MSENLESVVNKIAEILPSASFDFDNDGQLIIYTDFFMDWRREEALIDKYLQANRYRSVHEWALDSNYRLTDEGWVDEDGSLVDVYNVLLEVISELEEMKS